MVMKEASGAYIIMVTNNHAHLLPLFSHITISSAS
jgi:hypothetical protein